jgi:drug/metabolite transporter (DMT)-like permease
MRWPTIHWRLAQLYVQGNPEEQRLIAALFDGFNVYAGNYLGEFLGELSFSAFFVLSAWALLRSRRAPRWLAIVGLLTGILGWIGMFRNVTTMVAPVAAVNNYLLPVWMIAFGVVLIRARDARPSA